jgi:hypothetical protein
LTISAGEDHRVDAVWWLALPLSQFLDRHVGDPEDQVG